MRTIVGGTSHSRSLKRSLLRLSLALGVLALFVFLVPHESRAGRDVTGKWSLNADSSRSHLRYAIHMLLLRGDTTYHSRVLWWNLDGATFEGDEWGWNPSSVPPDSFPGRSFTSIGVASSGMDEFCAGHAPMANGRVLTAGGVSSVVMNYGENQSRVLRDTTGGYQKKWYNPGLMSQWRWYPTATVLGDGRVLVTSGERAPHHRFFGGTRNGSVPSGGVQDSVYRFLPQTNGLWDPSVVPDADAATGTRPRWRQFHTAVEMEIPGNIKGHVIFGGDSAGTPFGDLWYLHRDPNYAAADYRYRWEKKTSFFSGTLPSARSHHSAIAAPDARGVDIRNYMLVYGGRDATGGPPSDSLRVHRLDDFGGGRWFPFTPGGTSTPSARFAHTAIYDSTNGVGERMIVFGGIGADGQTPTDLGVWEMLFTSSDYSSGTWSKKTVVAADSGSLDRRPAPRFGHSMVWDASFHWNTRVRKWGHVGFLYGGQLGGTTYSDTLWALWLFNDGTVGWQPRLFSGPHPSARARHSMVLDDRQGNFVQGTGTGGVRLYIYGGENQTGSVDDSMYVVDPWDSTATTPTWAKWAGKGVTLSGQSVTLDRQETDARTPDVFDPAASSLGQWQSQLTSTTLLQDTYPPTFVISGGNAIGDRVLSIAQNDSSYYMDVATSGSGTGWTKHDGLRFAPESGVLYGLNKIMVAGGADTSGSAAAVGTTKTLDAGDLSHTWQTSGSMAARGFTNLVLLPNGKVLAIGGIKSTLITDTASTLAMNRPQIWDPGAGTWTDTTVLDRQPSMRNYHSTAVLLPDGRILSGSGEYQNDKYLFNVFCPPYLFKNDTLATRPVVTGSPDTLQWGAGGTYTILLSDTTGVRNGHVALLRSGATTHAFDQNQRYVPLGFSLATGPTRLLVSAPVDQSVAPPGNYLLFVTGSKDGSDVPSIAKWVRLTTAGQDPSDTIAPDSVTDLSAACDPNTPNGWILSWTAPADDGSLPASGRVRAIDLRRSTGHITNSNWSSATDMGGPTPLAPGSIQTLSAGASSQFYIRLKSGDDANHLSAISNEIGIYAWSSRGENCPPGGGMYASGGGNGGGGLFLNPASNGASLQSQDRRSPRSRLSDAENSLFNGVSMGASATDVFRLAVTRPMGTTLPVRLRELASHVTAVQAARLYIVDHRSTLSAYALNGTILTGVPRNAKRIIASDGTDLTAVLDGSGTYSLAPGEELRTELSPGGGRSPLLLAASGTGGILIQTPDGRGGWRTVTQTTPRVDPDEFLLSAPGADSMRIVVRGYAAVSFIGSLVVTGDSPVVQAAPLRSARSARLGDVRLVTSTDSLSATLIGPDTLALAFAVEPPAQGLIRDYFLAVTATPLNPEMAANSGVAGSPGKMPLRFELSQNRPNPFSETTSIRFALPIASQVKLEIFDTQGRRVRTLAEGQWAAGYQAVDWDKRNDHGRLARPGIYLCRLTAGTFRTQRKMVLLP